MNPYGAKQEFPFQVNFLGDFEEIADSRSRGCQRHAQHGVIRSGAVVGATPVRFVLYVLGGGIGQTLAAAQDALSQQQLLGGGIKKQVTQAEAELAALGDGPKGDTSRLNRFWNQLPEWFPAALACFARPIKRPALKRGSRPIPNRSHQRRPNRGAALPRQPACLGLVAGKW